MKLRDREMMQGLIDMSDIRVTGQALRPITSTTPELVGNRKQRRAQESNTRRKKKKFARS